MGFNYLKRFRVCEICGKEFVVESRSRQIYCSERCVKNKNNLIKREERQQNAKPNTEKKPRTAPRLSIEEVQALARKAGLTYGQYVGKYLMEEN